MHSFISLEMTDLELEAEDLAALIRISNKYRVGIRIGDPSSVDSSYLMTDFNSQSLITPNKSLDSPSTTEKNADLKELEQRVICIEKIQARIFTSLSQTLQDYPDGKLRRSILALLMGWEK
jgi:hypothetical protein